MEIKHNFKRVNCLIITVFLFFVVGCASKISQTTTIQEVSGTQDYNKVSAVVQSDNADVKQQKDYQETVQNLLTQIKQKLSESNIFESIVEPTDKVRKISIIVNIQQLRVVSKSQRIMSGVLPGEAIMGGSIILKDSESQKVIGSIDFIEKSGISGGLFSDHTDNQIEIVSEKVVNLFKDKF